MARKNENLEQAIASEQAPSTPNRDRWLENMRGKYPDIENEDDLYARSMEGYDAEHDFAKQQREENASLNELITSNPELARFYNEMFERGKEGHPEMALLNVGDLLKAYITGEMTSDEYIAEKEKRSQAESEQQKKLEAQNAVFTAWCEKKGYDPEEWATRAAEKLFTPMANHELAEAQFDAIDKMLNYDDDVEAAEVRGRNANISSQRRRQQGSSDGMMNTTSAGGGTSADSQKNTIADIANQRAAMRRNL